MRKLGDRSPLAMVLLFTAALVIALWGLTVRWQEELREQVSGRAEQRSAQLADAMAGQVEADFRLLDHLLLDLRDHMSESPEALKAMAQKELSRLPEGWVLYMSRLDASGRLVANLDDKGLGRDLSDRPYFQAAKSGEDRLLIGVPFESRVDGAWLIPVGRALYLDGRFDGALFLLVSPEFVAQSLKRSMLADDDIVAMVHPSGQLIARSLQNQAAMGQVVPGDRPFQVAGAGDSGAYRRVGLVDEVSRFYGWRRLPETGLVMVVGLSESSVLAPLASSIKTSQWLTSALSAVLILGGLVLSRLLWKDGLSARAMRESEQQLKGAQRMAKLGHWSQDLRTGANHWSEEVYRIFGFDPEGPELSAKDVLKRVHPDDRQRLKTEIETAMQSGGELEVIHRIVLPDGSEKHLRAHFEFEAEDGVTVHNRGTVQDITEVRVAQLALKEMNEKLESRVESRTRDLDVLNKELEAFTYSVSHDLRTPLRSIHGFASLLQEEGEALSAEGRTHLRRIQDGARRMGLLITDLLTMSHQSRAVVNLQRVNLSELAQAVVQDIEREDRQREVVWNIGAALWAWADPVLMRVVLQNLLGNAWKYTNQTAQVEISFQRVGQAGAMIEFCVRDNGAGFDMAYVDQLFQPFKRLHAHHEFEGTGVGLASVQRLIQRHGGTVRAEGLVGQGAAFFFTLPDRPMAARPPAA